MASSRSRKDHVTRASGQNGRAHEINKAFAKNKHRGSGTGSQPFTPDHAFHFAIFQCFLVAILTRLVLSLIGDEAEGRENGFHKTLFNCGEHDILMTPGIIFDKPATHVHLLLNTRNCLSRKSTLAFGNRHSSPPQIRFRCLFSPHFIIRPSRIKSRPFKSWKSKFIYFPLWLLRPTCHMGPMWNLM